MTIEPTGTLWAAAKITDKARESVKRASDRAVSGGKDKIYKIVAEKTGFPWQLIAALHSREAANDLTKTIKDGSELHQGTNWIKDATEQLQQIAHWKGVAWTVVNSLDAAEAYNGEGYRKRLIRAPYVWAGTNWQQSGKYVADGKFDQSTWDTQPGVAAMFLYWREQGELEVTDTTQAVSTTNKPTQQSFETSAAVNILNEAAAALRMFQWALPPNLKTAAAILLALEPTIAGAIEGISTHGLDHMKFADLLATLSKATGDAATALKG